MAKEKGKEAPVEKLEDKDNPSLIKADEEIRLRVFDDFFIEKSLPKWQDFDKRCAALKTRLKARYMEDSDVKEALKKLDDPEEVKKIEDVLGIRSPVTTATSGVLAPQGLTESTVRDLERRAEEARRYIRLAENYWEQSRYDTTFNNIDYDDSVIFGR